MQDNKMKKLLLMGRSGAGKTSMHSIIFANYPANETLGIGYTVDIEESKIRFLGQLTLNLWDCGGQDKLMKQWFSTKKGEIFKNVEVLIYVFEVDNQGKEFDDDMRDYKLCVQNIKKYSPDANVFILIHKLDKIKENEREAVMEKKTAAIMEESEGVTIKQVFGTSIWDETLYKAWSQIVQYLIPDLDFIKTNLTQLCVLSGSDEIVLFEKQTFLIIAYHEQQQNQNILKYERLSNIIKQFKLSCYRIGQANINNMCVKGSNFTAVIEEFTDNTYIMIVFSDPKVTMGAVEYNIKCSKKIFEEKDNQKLLEQQQQM